MMGGGRVGLYERNGLEIEIVQIQNEENFGNFKKRILSEIGLNLNDFDVMFVRKKCTQPADKSHKSNDSTTLTPSSLDFDLTLSDENEPRRPSLDYSADDSYVSEPVSESSTVPNSTPNAENTVIVYPTVPCKVTQKRQCSEMAQDHDNTEQGEFTGSHSVKTLIYIQLQVIQPDQPAAQHKAKKLKTSPEIDFTACDTCYAMVSSQFMEIHMLRSHRESSTSSNDNTEDSDIDASSIVKKQPMSLGGLNSSEVVQQIVTKVPVPRPKIRKLRLNV